MSECECLKGCPFFNDKMKNYPATVEMIKKNYCLGDNSQCARFMAFKALGRENVPHDLYPDEIEQAKKIIEQSK